MAKFIVEQSGQLKGSVNIEGAKNSALPILSACILSNSICRLYKIPDLSDINTMCKLLENLGIKINKNSTSLDLNMENIFLNNLNTELVKKIRASILLAGPILARFGEVEIPMPGGCAIGLRPVDLHLKGFSLMGAEIEQAFGNITIKAKNLVGAEIYLDFPSVGATENLMMTATLAKGETIISNCAIEPEIVDLAEFLNKMGAKIEGAGTDTIKIKGVEQLGGCSHTIIPDRIEAGTFLVAGAITRGEIEVLDVNIEHLKSVTAKLREINLDIQETENSIKICSRHNLKNVDIKTMPYPSFPTDMQPQFISFMSTIEGTGILTETVFENRFAHIGELCKMGGDIKVEGQSCIIQGVTKLMGTEVQATDLRAGAGLVIAGLYADGETTINDIYHIERGYYKFDEKLKNLGAKIKRLEE